MRLDEVQGAGPPVGGPEEGVLQYSDRGNRCTFTLSAVEWATKQFANVIDSI